MAAATATMVSQVPEDTRKMIARTATAVAATAQPRQITDAQVTAGFQAAIQAAIFQAAGSRAAAQDPEDHRGQPDQQALRVQWDPEDAPEHRALPDQLVPWGLRAM
ncbi:hypothetical protein [Enterocloster bolteae]|uniref:hypothetical protein n=1 Tax=Enterocloster bolteae TaxID=208479 RepID=UPI0036F25D1C